MYGGANGQGMGSNGKQSMTVAHSNIAGLSVLTGGRVGAEGRRRTSQKQIKSRL